MTVIFESGYSLPSGDQPLKHARIAHSRNWLEGGTATASSTATDFFADAPLNTLTYEFWKPTAVPATWEYDHGSAIECDYCAIAAHTLGSVQATVKAQYYNGSAWVDLCAGTAVNSDSPIFIIFEPVTAQRWRIYIENAVGQVACIKFGSALQMTQPIYGGHAPLDYGRNTVLRSNYSETGENLGRTKQRSYLSTSYTWTHIKADWVRSNWGNFQKAVEAEPFWIAWRPITFGEVGFCQTDETPGASNMGVKDYMQLELSVRARGYD